jgi:membrane glycosyltransferase
LPVLAGLLLSAFLTMVSSRVDVGLWLRQRGLLLTPEETSPPAELAAMHRALLQGIGAEAPMAAGLALVVRGDTLQTPALAPLRMEPSKIEYQVPVPTP